MDPPAVHVQEIVSTTSYSPSNISTGAGAFTSIYDLLCPPRHPQSSNSHSRSPSSGTSFEDYVPSRTPSPPNAPAISPDYPYSIYSPLDTNLDTNIHQEDYFSPRFRDVDGDLRPGYTSHFLTGSYTRTNTQPTTRVGTSASPSLADQGTADPSGGGAETADGQQHIYGPHPPPQLPPAFVAHGLGYDAARQRMIYRRILERTAATPSASVTAQAEIEVAEGEREYTGYEGDYDTGTTATATESTTNSGVVSESGGSGRESPLEERSGSHGVRGGMFMGEFRRGWNWSAFAGGQSSRVGRGAEVRGKKGEKPEVRVDKAPGPQLDQEDEEEVQYENESDRPLLERGGWSGEMVPTSMYPYGSNDNTPRATTAGGLSSVVTRLEDASEGDDAGEGSLDIDGTKDGAREEYGEAGGSEDTVYRSLGGSETHG